METVGLNQRKALTMGLLRPSPTSTHLGLHKQSQTWLLRAGQHSRVLRVGGPILYLTLDVHSRNKTPLQKPPEYLVKLPRTCQISSRFSRNPKFTRLFEPRSVKSYFPVLCSNLMNHPLCNLPWRTFWSPMYFPPPPRPAQPASGKNPSVYLSKLGCEYLVALLRHDLRWIILLAEKPPVEDRSTARASLLLLLQEEIARERFKPHPSCYWGWKATSESAPRIKLRFPLAAAGWLNEAQRTKQVFAAALIFCVTVFLHKIYLGKTLEISIKQLGDL